MDSRQVGKRLPGFCSPLHQSSGKRSGSWPIPPNVPHLTRTRLYGPCQPSSLPLPLLPSPTHNASLSLLVINHLYITLFSHVGRLHHPRICLLYFFMGSSNKVGRFIYYPCVQSTIGSLGGVVLTRGTLCRNQCCSSRYYSPEFTIRSNTIIENAYTNHKILTIQTDVVRCSYRPSVSSYILSFHEGKIVEADVGCEI
jgi:hypothetical protein